MTLARILILVERIRRSSEVPVILMGYFNPLLAFGVNRFPQRAASAGVDGLIIPDLPVEEAHVFRKEAEKSGLSMIFLASPTSSAERLRLIDRSSTDLVYAVTVTGVTGARKGFSASTDTYLDGLKQRLSKKFVAGFGVSSADTAKRFVRYADGVVIGSALVDVIKSARNRADCVSKVERFLKNIRKAI
jgi:tryptophan synthase alpha chain